MNCSTFKGFSKVSGEAEISEILTICKSNSIKYDFATLRKLYSDGKSDQYSELKKTLPSFTPSGTFLGTRVRANLKKYSGIFVLDIDKVPDDKVLLIRLKIQSIPFTFASFISPSGHGFKIFVRSNSIPELHKRNFDFLKKYYENILNFEVDKSGSDFTRLCFYSHDPDLYINYNSLLFYFPSTDSDIDVFNYINLLEEKNIDVTENYDDWVKCCFAFLTLNSPAALLFFIRISFLSPKYNYDKCIDLFEKCSCRTQEGVSIGTFFFLCNKFFDLNNIPKPGMKSVVSVVKDNVTGEVLNKFMIVRKFIENNYDIRFNVVSLGFEFKRKTETQFIALNENTIYCEMLMQNITVSLNNLIAYLKSDFIIKYDPFQNYFDSLSPWDQKTDFIEKLSNYITVTDNVRESFRLQFKKWLVRAVKCSLVPSFFNKQAFILVSDTQNCGKSTFCRFLCPPVLGDYIAENIAIDKDSRLLLATNFLINLDELSTLSKFELNSLKSLFSKDKINERLPYDRRNSILMRRANFIGSTNMAEFLSDETGSVRWLCFYISNIDFNYSQDININDVYSQAYFLYKNNYDCNMSANDVKMMGQQNREYFMHYVELDLIQKYLLPGTNSTDSDFMTTTDILLYLQDFTNNTVKLNPVTLGKCLKFMGFEKSKSGPVRTSGYYIYKKISVFLNDSTNHQF